jgi:hypothetical protein
MASTAQPGTHSPKGVFLLRARARAGPQARRRAPRRVHLRPCILAAVGVTASGRPAKDPTLHAVSAHSHLLCSFCGKARIQVHALVSAPAGECQHPVWLTLIVATDTFWPHRYPADLLSKLEQRVLRSLGGE